MCTFCFINRLEIQHSGYTSFFSSYNSLRLVIEPREVDHTIHLTGEDVFLPDLPLGITNRGDALHGFQAAVLEN